MKKTSKQSESICGVMILNLAFTYIIGHYNPLSQDYDLASHNTYIASLIVFTVIVFARNLLRESRRRNIFIFSF